jgi:hypothetical protein
MAETTNLIQWYIGFPKHLNKSSDQDAYFMPYRIKKGIITGFCPEPFQFSPQLHVVLLQDSN